MSNKFYKRKNNKNGYALFLIMIFFLLVIFWRMAGTTFEIINCLNNQKVEMKNGGIRTAPEEIATFELE